MRRSTSLRRALAAGALGLLLLAGCGRGIHRADSAPPAAPPTVPASAVTVQGGGAPGNLDNQLKSVDGLLDDLDNQVNSDGQTPPDAD